MKKLATSFILAGSMLLTACASTSNWAPTVDPYNDPKAAKIPQNTAECKQLASKASGDTDNKMAQGIGIGALIGAAGGAAIGAIAGNPGTGAAIGATAGALTGGTHQGLSAEDTYKKAFSNCMRNRGHNVLD